ncbi:unnamed protein product [Pieris brassicae]|uniref:Uncharacterized protein n=1 Tax=Pieris brassicae TaxID=7116 RepID=A0A9P0TN52_PIEBR|nr:unnamed protein product [Pieris brassicae]
MIIVLCYVTSFAAGNDSCTGLVSDIGHNIIQDAFLIAVEEQARQRLQRLSALKRITPVDMSKLSLELNRKKRSQSESKELNGYIANSTVYVTSINENGAIESKPVISSPKSQPKALQAKPAPVIANGIQDKEENEKDLSDKCDSVVLSDALNVVREHLSNGRCEKLLGESVNRTTGQDKLTPGENR